MQSLVNFGSPAQISLCRLTVNADAPIPKRFSKGGGIIAEFYFAVPTGTAAQALFKEIGYRCNFFRDLCLKVVHDAS